MRKFLPKTNSPIFLRVAQESNLNAGKQNRVSLALDDLSHVAPDLIATQGSGRTADEDNYVLSAQKSRNGPVEVLGIQRAGPDITISSPQQMTPPSQLRTRSVSYRHPVATKSSCPSKTQHSSLAPPSEKAKASSITSLSDADLAPSDSKRRLRDESTEEKTRNRKKRKAYCIPAEADVFIIDD